LVPLSMWGSKTADWFISARCPPSSSAVPTTGWRSATSSRSGSSRSTLSGNGFRCRCFHLEPSVQHAPLKTRPRRLHRVNAADSRVASVQPTPPRRPVRSSPRPRHPSPIPLENPPTPSNPSVNSKTCWMTGIGRGGIGRGDRGARRVLSSPNVLLCTAISHGSMRNCRGRMAGAHRGTCSSRGFRHRFSGTIPAVASSLSLTVLCDSSADSRHGSRAGCRDRARSRTASGPA
jgi:hypothetical protein